MNVEKLRRRSERALAVLPATHPAASKARRAAAGVGTGTTTDDDREQRYSINRMHNRTGRYRKLAARKVGRVFCLSRCLCINKRCARDKKHCAPPPRPQSVPPSPRACRGIPIPCVTAIRRQECVEVQGPRPRLRGAPANFIDQLEAK